MQIKQERYAVGVIVGRFQVPELHDPHRALIKHVIEAHEKVIIFLGLSPLLVTRENPLDFEARKQMLLEEFSDINVHYIKDTHSDELWSKRLDGMIGDLVTPAQDVMLYGGRDSFIAHYTGKYPTRELEQEVWVSGNEIRHRVSQRSVRKSSDFRSGVVWAAYSKFPTVYTTVDIAIFSEDGRRLLLGKKPQEPRYRFFGGFADPGSLSFEEDARRGVMEEVGIEITFPSYLGSYNIDDWRYRREVDQIRTMFFSATYQFGAIRPGDDIEQAKWFPLSEIKPSDIMPVHHSLLGIALANRPKIKIEGY